MTRDDNRALNTMRNLVAQGWHDEALLIDTAAQVLGGGDAAQRRAKRVYDAHMRITTP